MNWHDYDEKLIRRGELILDLEFVRGYRSELDTMNGGKEGKPFKLTHTYMHFLAVVRYLYGMPYRQLETRSDARRQEVDLYRCLGHEKWAEEKGYGLRHFYQISPVCKVQAAYELALAVALCSGFWHVWA